MPAWWNGALLMTIGFGALVARAFETDLAARLAWLTVAAAGFALNLDEIAGLHERLGAPSARSASRCRRSPGWCRA